MTRPTPEEIRSMIERLRWLSDKVIGDYGRELGHRALNAADMLESLMVEIERLRKIEAAAVKATEHLEWSGDHWYNDMLALEEALKEG